MSAVGVCLNALLVGLLVAALALGWRLDRRLRALRAAHQSFLEAVRELDRASARVRAELAELRTAAVAASDLLERRIQRAETLTVGPAPLPAPHAPDRRSPPLGRTQRIERLLALARRPAILDEAPEAEGDEELFVTPPVRASA